MNTSLLLVHPITVQIDGVPFTVEKGSVLTGTMENAEFCALPVIHPTHETAYDRQRAENEAVERYLAKHPAPVETEEEDATDEADVEESETEEVVGVGKTGWQTRSKKSKS